MEIILVCALSEDHVIGKEGGGLPWHLPEEIQWFRSLIEHQWVMTGKKTYLESRGLFLGKETIILSRDPSFRSDSKSHRVISDLQQAISLASDHAIQELWVLGGGAVFEATLPLATQMCLSIVHRSWRHLVNPTRFPEWNEHEWKEIWCRHHPASPQNPIAFTSSRFLRVASFSDLQDSPLSSKTFQGGIQSSEFHNTTISRPK